MFEVHPERLLVPVPASGCFGATYRANVRYLSQRGKLDLLNAVVS